MFLGAKFESYAGDQGKKVMKDTLLEWGVIITDDE